MHHEQPSDQSKFRVQIGHTEVTVSCATAAEAVRLARKMIARDMPRLWDLVHNIDERRFLVARAL